MTGPQNPGQFTGRLAKEPREASQLVSNGTDSPSR